MASSEPNQKPMLGYAQEYLGMGYPVFPVCSPRMGRHDHGQKPCTNPGKRPLVSWEPYQSRLPSEDEVRSWWSHWPTANIGMATGVRSGVVVLDCDSVEARQEALSAGGLDKTPAVWTGKPGGVHFWLEHPIDEVRNFARRLPGLDFRGDGGYVLLPPSVHASGASYRWNANTAGMALAPIPEWLWELLRGTGEAEGAPGEHEPLDVEEMLQGFPEGQRDDGLFRFACRLRHDDTPRAFAETLIATAARNCRPPFDVAEAVAKVRYVYRKYEPGNVGPTVIEDRYFAPLNAKPVLPAPEAPPAVFFRPISELLAMPEVEPDWMVDQLFTVASNGWVAAEPKVGKSWVVLELAYALSTGMPFLGRFAVKQPRRVLYVQEEDSLQRVLRRLKKIIKGDASRISPSDEYWRWSIRVGFKLDNLLWLEMLRQEIVAFKAEVIILDVFNRLHGSDENKQSEMTAILNNLTRLTNDYGCAFVIVHHNRKQQQGDEARANQKIRGSGVLAGWSECSLYLRRSKDKDTIIVTPESKDAPEMDDFTIILTDTDNGGMFLQVGDAEPVSRMSKADTEAMEAVRSISARGVGATIQAVAGALDKDRTTVQRRLTRLVEAGYLTSYAISDAPKATHIYEAVEQ
jgi:hypothetical protein